MRFLAASRCPAAAALATAGFLVCCAINFQALGAAGDSPAGPAPASPAQAPQAASQAAMPAAPMEKVLGFGGFFFRSKDPKGLAKWYEDHLGVTMTPEKEGGATWQQASGTTVFQPFPETTKYFGAQDKQWMIDFRVSNLDAMVRQLKAGNIDVKVDPTVYSIGRFARLYDPEGNAVELWEPNAAREAAHAKDAAAAAGH